MPTLTLINGAPGSGKSTLATLLARDHTLTLTLDIDSVRGSLAHWTDDPVTAGLAARELALNMSATHLRAGHNVIIPQFLQREEYLDRLASTAQDSGAEFFEVCLTSSPQEAAARFAARASSEDQNHKAAQMLQSMPRSAPVEDLYRNMYSMALKRPDTIFVESIPWDIQQTLACLREDLQNRAGSGPRP